MSTIRDTWRRLPDSLWRGVYAACEPQTACVLASCCHAMLEAYAPLRRDGIRRFVKDHVVPSACNWGSERHTQQGGPVVGMKRSFVFGHRTPKFLRVLKTKADHDTSGVQMLLDALVREADPRTSLLKARYPDGSRLLLAIKLQLRSLTTHQWESVQVEAVYLCQLLSKRLADEFAHAVHTSPVNSSHPVACEVVLLGDMHDSPCRGKALYQWYSEVHRYTYTEPFPPALHGLRDL